MTESAHPSPARLAQDGERFYRLLAENSADVFAIFDLESRAIYVSPSVYRLRGYTAEECMSMDEDVRAKAFEPFFTTKDIGAGPGLGLAMVYGSVQQHGGRVEMDSAPGVGTTVRIQLPAVMPEGGRLRPAATVLIAEEDYVTAERLFRTLGGAGYTVLRADSAEEALAVAAGHGGPIDVLVTSVMFARLNGAELAARLRRDRPRLRTLFVVEAAGEPDPRFLLHAPQGWLVPRKFTPESLLDKVAHALQAPAARPEGDPGQPR